MAPRKKPVLTNFWTKDGQKWTVQGTPAEVLATLGWALSTKTPWAEFKATDNHIIYMRKEWICVVEEFSDEEVTVNLGKSR